MVESDYEDDSLRRGRLAVHRLYRLFSLVVPKIKRAQGATTAARQAQAQLCLPPLRTRHDRVRSVGGQFVFHQSTYLLARGHRSLGFCDLLVGEGICA